MCYNEAHLCRRGGQGPCLFAFESPTDTSDLEGRALASLGFRFLLSNTGRVSSVLKGSLRTKHSTCAVSREEENRGDQDWGHAESHLLRWQSHSARLHELRVETVQREGGTRRAVRSRNRKRSEVTRGSLYGGPIPSAVHLRSSAAKRGSWGTTRLREKSSYLWSDEQFPKRTQKHGHKREKLLSLVSGSFLPNTWDDCYQTPRLPWNRSKHKTLLRPQPTLHDGFQHWNTSHPDCQPHHRLLERDLPLSIPHRAQPTEEHITDPQ